MVVGLLQPGGPHAKARGEATRLRLTLDHRHLVARAGQAVGQGQAKRASSDDACSPRHVCAPLVTVTLLYATSAMSTRGDEACDCGGMANDGHCGAEVCDCGRRIVIPV